MNVACLAWGSLVWDPRELPIRRRWFDDGPFGQVEFVRKSKDGRVTLALCEAAQPVRLLWAPMDLTDLQAAKEALKLREGLTGKMWEKDIGCWGSGAPEPSLIHGLGAWAQAHGVEAVVWTALKPKFDIDPVPSADSVVGYLAQLMGAKRDCAEQYVRRAPPQIDTRYRRRIESELGWIPDSA